MLEATTPVEPVQEKPAKRRAQEKPPIVDLRDPSLDINRELSNVEFNRRVLEESANTDHPMLERLRFERDVPATGQDP